MHWIYIYIYIYTHTHNRCTKFFPTYFGTHGVLKHGGGDFVRPLCMYQEHVGLVL
jgi:hypothetical protein